MHYFNFSGAGKVAVNDLDASKCTIYIYAFATLNPTTYQIQAHDVNLDITLKVSTITRNTVCLKKCTTFVLHIAHSMLRSVESLTSDKSRSLYRSENRTEAR